MDRVLRSPTRRFLAAASIVGALLFVHFEVPAAGPTFSTPIVLDPDNNFVLAVNPDNDTVSVVPTWAPSGTQATEYPTGREPQSLALTPDGSKLYVANAVSGTVTVFRTYWAGSPTLTWAKTINVGTEPWSLALTPNGKKLYVANSSSNSVSVIDTATDRVTKTIPRVGPQPRGIAITSDDDAYDDDEKVYVTAFLAQYRPGQIRPGDDRGKVGVVSVLSTSTDEVIRTIQLQPIDDTGFKSDGDALNKIAATGSFTITTGAFPNILASAAIRGNRLYIPSTGSSPNGPVRFNVNVQGLVSVVDTATDIDTGKTVNLNSGVQFETDANDSQGRPLKRFLTNPYFIALRRTSNSGYIVSSASDMIVKIDFGADGTPTINPPAAAGQPSGIKRILTGSNPRAMVMDRLETKGFVWNYISRDVTVVDLTNDTAIGRLILARQPTDQQGVKVQRGKELFFSSIGPFFPVGGVLEGAMSDRGWCSCASCHPDGLSDGVVWMFPAGPRRSTPLNSTFAKGGTGQRALNWSAIFDEVADFELNTRNVAGGSGLIRNPDGTPNTSVNAFTVPSAGRSEDRDAITEYVRLGIRSPISPVPSHDVRVAEGRQVFKTAGCPACHGGPNWTVSRVEFPPPPPASALVAEQGSSQLVGQLMKVGTFDPSRPFELVGTGPNMSKQALGTAGFNPPSLRGIHALGPYLHNGTLETLDDILANPHWSTRVLTGPAKRKQLVRFLQSIDDSTPPFP